jgi:hypothetical protein
MKKNLLFSFLLCIFLFSCSENDIDELSIKSNEIDVENDSEPYISEEMQKILDMIDTCTTAMPIEKLIPFDVKAFNEVSSDKSLSLKSVTSSNLVTGYSTSSTLYTRVKTVISETQADNFDTTAGTYYVTCKSATYYLESNGTVYPAYTDGDIMGINPEDLTQVGYSSEEIVPGALYYLTTYIWGLSECGSSDCVVFTLIPIYYYSIGDYLEQLQWRYYEF